MNTPDSERILQSVLRQQVEQQTPTTKRLVAAIAAGQREATEITRLEAARRERIEAESMEKIAKAQKQRHRLQQRLASSPPAVRLPESLEFARTAVPPEKLAARAAMVDNRQQAPASQTSAEPTHQQGLERRDQPAAAQPAELPRELQVKARREYIVKLEDNSVALVDSVVKQVEILIEERDQQILQRVQSQLAEIASSRIRSISKLGGD